MENVKTFILPYPYFPMRAVERYENNLSLLDYPRLYAVQRRFLSREHGIELLFEPEQPVGDAPTILERTLHLPVPKLFDLSVTYPFDHDRSTLSGATLTATLADDALCTFSRRATYGLLGIVTAGVLLYAETDARGETLDYRQPDLDLALEILAARNFRADIVPYHLERQRLLDAKFAERAVQGVASLQQQRIARTSRQIAEQLVPFVPAQAHRMKVGLEGHAF